MLDEHVMAARHLCDLKLFGSMSAANDWLRKRQANEEVRFYTRYRIKEREKLCKPEYFYHSADVWFKKDNLRHEVYLTEFLALYWRQATSLRRGMEVNRDLLADAEITLNGVRYLVELDTGTMTHKQLRARFKKLAESKDTVLFVTLGREKRLRGILKTAGGFDVALIATSFGDVFKSPRGRVWHQPGATTLLELDLPPEIPPAVPT